MPYLNNLLFKPYDKKFINQIENSLIDKYHLRKYLNKVFPYNILHFLGLYNNNLLDMVSTAHQLHLNHFPIVLFFHPVSNF